MTRSYGMIFFFFCQWTIRFTLNFVSTFNTHKPTNIYCGTWYVYIFAEFLFLKISQIAPKKLEEKATEKEGENSRKINCPLSPSDTITAGMGRAAFYLGVWVEFQDHSMVSIEAILGNSFINGLWDESSNSQLGLFCYHLGKSVERSQHSLAILGI